ncbi:hypothetical protein [Metabacillus fastidiosus]|uniref:hypothetical protein n=1 Tax=Metabacillus fastidiosus TaxID=1458 RepID=UPI002E1CC15A|nr:hypothetical protein [Metabacillus fastidiosus]
MGKINKWVVAVFYTIILTVISYFSLKTLMELGMEGRLILDFKFNGILMAFFAGILLLAVVVRKYITDSTADEKERGKLGNLFIYSSVCSVLLLFGMLVINN